MKRFRFYIPLLFALIFIACGGDAYVNGYDTYTYDDEINEYDQNNYVDEDVENSDSEITIPVTEEDWLSDFNGYLIETFQADDIPGMAVAVVQDDEIVFANGYGLRDVENNLPVTPETLFHIGSTHKSINSMLIATLVDDGLFTWDTLVSEIYPAFTLSNSAYTDRVTMRHLLSMRAGIPDYAEDDLSETAPAERVFPVLANADLLGEPGEEFSYSNLSAAAAGYLAVIATGGDATNLYDAYADLLQTKILTPIGMTEATIYASEAADYPNVSYSYAVYGDGEAELTPSYDRDGDALAPSGSLKASVLDMARYISTQLNGGVAPNGNRVVSEVALSETWQTYLEDYGMGWERQQHKGVEIIMHTGAYDGFVSVLGFFPEYGVGFVILVNSEDVGDNIIENAPYELAELLLDSFE